MRGVLAVELDDGVGTGSEGEALPSIAPVIVAVAPINATDIASFADLDLEVERRAFVRHGT